MVRGLLIFFGIVIAGIIGVHTVLENGSFLRYLDQHPNPQWVPPTEYYAGNMYYIFQDLQESAAYFIRVRERYPTSPYADDADFAYLQCLDDMGTVSRGELVEHYTKYLERFPNGKHTTAAKYRIDAYRSGASIGRSLIRA